jgi:Holliday junction resolvase
MPAPNHSRSLSRSDEFERRLAESLGQAGWRVDRQPKLADAQPDLVARHGRKKYVFELKVSSEGRKDRAVPLISQAILEVQSAARRFPGAAIPVAVIAADHISNPVAGGGRVPGIEC